MWVIASYEATSLFSLKPATSTVSGGKTLLVPTPFAIKMALVNVICQVEGLAAAEMSWEWLGKVPVALRPARAVVVNNTFIKILKPRRNPAKEGAADAGYFQRTITYREYAQLDGTFGIALWVEDDDQAIQLQEWLMYINYLGKRGSFVQITALPDTEESYDNLPADFIIVDGNVNGMSINDLLTQLDDVGEKVTFEHIDIYSKKRLSLGKHRVLQHVALPYRMESSSRGYTYYINTQTEASTDNRHD
jgi:hypothetical protein